VALLKGRIKSGEARYYKYCAPGGALPVPLGRNGNQRSRRDPSMVSNF